VSIDVDEKLENYKALFFTNYKWLRKLATKKFPKSKDDADAAFNFVLYEISNHNWKRLLVCDEKSFHACFKKIAHHLLADYQRKHSGRFHIPKSVQDRGPLFVEIYRCFCFNQMSHEEIREKVNFFLDEMPDCKSGFKQFQTESDDDIPDESDDMKLHAYIIDLVGKAIMSDEFVQKDNDENKDDVDRLKTIRKIIDQFRSTLVLTTEDRLFLKMRYQKEVTIANAGKIVFGLSQRDSYSKHDQLKQYILEQINKTQLASKLRELIKNI